MQAITGWKVFTHDFRSPIQAGPALWDGQENFLLPKVRLDQGAGECAAGWNFCRSLATTFRVGGLWPTGRPSVACKVEAVGIWVERGEKCRSEQLLIRRRATADEIEAAVLELSAPFGEHQQTMAAEQLVWREALARPTLDKKLVELKLQEALTKRGLSWALKEFADARAIWAAWDARAAWAARDAWDAWAAWAAWAAWPAWDASAAWDARAAWAAWGASAAWDARAALILYFAAKKGWIHTPPDLLTIGLREAYQHGLAIALPTGPNELGWTMPA